MKNQTYQKTKHTLWKTLLISLMIGGAFALFVFSPKTISPTNTAWVLGGGGDNFQHYIGWRFFRNAPWDKHFLFMQNLNYPAGSSVIVMDSNPFFCLLFKLFDPVLPQAFQFNGIWLLTSYLLNASFAALIAYRLTHHIGYTLAASIFVVLNPVILQRALIHDTLTAHWLILAAIWLALESDRSWNPFGWFLLTGLTLLIHIYFLPMIAFILILQILYDRFICHRSFLAVWVPFAVFLLTFVLGYVGLGYRYIQAQSGSYGELSLNLNAFFNPDGVSRWIHSRPTLPLQYEGFNYFGLGLILLCVITLPFLVRAPFRRFFGIGLIPCLIFLQLSLSHEVYFDKFLLYRIPLSENILNLLSVFRSSGRLVWPFYYLALFSAIKILSEVPVRRISLILPVVCCCLIQILDLTPLISEAKARFSSPMAFPAEILSELEVDIPQHARHLAADGFDAKTLDGLALFAADHGLTYNHSNNARSIRPIYGAEPLELSALTCEALSPETVYLLPESRLMDFASCAERVQVISNGMIMVR